MGFLKGILRFLKKILNTIKKMLSKIFKRFGILLVLFVIACFVFPGLLPALLAMVGVPGGIVASVATVFGTTGTIASWGILGQVAAGVGVAALISPSTVKAAAENIGKGANSVVDNVGDVLGNAGEVVGDVGSGVLDGVGKIATHPVVLIGGGLFLLYLLTRDSGDRTEVNPSTIDVPNGPSTNTYPLPPQEIEYVN